MASPRSLYGRKAPPTTSVRNACAHNGSPATPRDATMVSEVVFGWGGSGPRKSIAFKANEMFDGAAGTKTAGLGPTSVSPRRKSIRGMDDQMDSLIREDYLQETPKSKYLARYDSHAGIGTAETIVSNIKQRKRIPPSHDRNNFGNHAGFRGRQSVVMKGRPILSLDSAADTLWHGAENNDFDETHLEVMKQIGEGYAGCRPPRKNRQKGGKMQVGSKVSEIVFNKSPSQDYAEFKHREYTANFPEHAGVKTGQMLRRSMSFPNFPGNQLERTLMNPVCEDLETTLEVAGDLADSVQGENMQIDESSPYDTIEPGELMQPSTPVTKTLTFKETPSTGSGSSSSSCSSRGHGPQTRWRH